MKTTCAIFSVIVVFVSYSFAVENTAGAVTPNVAGTPTKVSSFTLQDDKKLGTETNGEDATNIYNWNFYLKGPIAPTFTGLPFKTPSFNFQTQYGKICGSDPNAQIQPPVDQSMATTQATATVKPQVEKKCGPKIVAAPPPEGVYWKDFRGPPVPKDAILAGLHTKSGDRNPVYIGQAFFGIPWSGFQPVAIYNDTSLVANSYKQMTSTDKNIKILCSSDPPEKSGKLLKWVDADEALLHLDDDLVKAGYEDDYPLFFGRGHYRHHFVVGKAVRKSWGFRLYFPFFEAEEHVDEDVEILAYSKKFNEDIGLPSEN